MIAALATFTDVRVRVVVSPDLGDYAKRLLDQLPGR